MCIRDRQVHIRIHSIQPCFQTGNRLIGRREESRLFINVPDKPIRPLVLALHIEASAECSAGSQDPENLPISGLLVRKSVKAVQRHDNVECTVLIRAVSYTHLAMNAIDEMRALNRDIKQFFDENGAAYPVWQALEAEAGRYLR